MTVAELLEQKDKLLRAMTSGVLKVRVGEIETEYQSIEQMRQALAVTEAEISKQQSSVSGRSSVVVFR